MTLNTIKTKKMKKWRVALRKVYPRVNNSKALMSKVATDQEPKVVMREEAEAQEEDTEEEAAVAAEVVEVATNQEKTSMMMDSK